MNSKNILKIDDKGRVLIPEWVRVSKSLKVGSVVRVKIENGSISMEEVK